MCHLVWVYQHHTTLFLLGWFVLGILGPFVKTAGWNMGLLLYNSRPGMFNPLISPVPSYIGRRVFALRFGVTHYVSMRDLFCCGCMSILERSLLCSISFPYATSHGLPFVLKGLVSPLQMPLRSRPRAWYSLELQSPYGYYCFFFSFSSGVLVIACGWSF